MKRLYFGTLIVVCLGIFQTSCKKSNLTRDQWTITLATDLQDQTNITADYAGEIWEYSKDGVYIENGNVKGTWAFGSKKESMVITKTNGGGDTYNVLKLKKNEMWLEIPNEEEIHLTRLK